MFGILVSEKYYFYVISTSEGLKDNTELFPVYHNQTTTIKLLSIKKNA
jgi:hypothetical protein